MGKSFTSFLTQGELLGGESSELERTEEAKLSAFLRGASWQVTPHDGGFAAETASCVLAGLARKMDAPSPCRLYCLDPMEGMVRGLNPEAEFRVQETLWDGGKCGSR